ncbi:MAG: type I secretion protein TolC [Gammaproteobacteria bacterium]|nr:MAG: type I secretion protein TolC [Gammaproteobacteria bacterium]
MNKLALSSLAGLLFISMNSYAEDLLDVYQLALKNDTQLLAEYASQQAVGELAAQSRADFLPSVGVNVTTGRTWQDASYSNSSSLSNNSRFNAHGYALTITQPVYKRQNNVQKNKANIAIERAAASYELVNQDLIVRVAERYFDVLAKQDDMTFSLAEREAITRQLDQTEQRFDVGIATITDVTESQAAYDLANASVIGAENELKNSKERLRELLGRYIDSLASLKADTELVRPVPEDIEEWSRAALNQNPSIVMAKLAVDDSKQTISLQKSAHYPTLDLVGRHNYNSASDGSSGSSKVHQSTLGLEFNLALDVNGRVRSQTREAGHRLSQAMQNEEQQRRSVVRQSRESYNGVISGISRVAALKQAVVSNEKALESTEAGYEVGTRTTVDVLNVRRDLFRARRDYTSARYDYILSSLRLQQAAGMINLEDLSKINQWLEEAS